MRPLELLQELVVIRVGTDPKPDHRISVDCAHGAITNANACRVDCWVGMHLLESQAWVMRIVTKQSISLFA